ncbi:MAG: type I restriction endonuclease subunit R, partial [Coraliomargarita sp.]
LPLVVFEFKSAIREEPKIFDAFEQLTIRYKRSIPELFKYNAFCVISDGANSRAGSFFAKYDFWYPWRKVDGSELVAKDGIDSLYTMIQGLFHQTRLLDVIRNFVYLPDKSRQEQKILCRYPQYYAATKLYRNIVQHQKPEGDGKGGTYFGATGCGKSYTMLFLARLLMRSVDLSSPTIVLITDRTDLDGQLSELFTDAKGYIGDQAIESVESRDHLRELLKGRKSGGVFLTTIHKFTEDTELLTDRTNVICISDEAHRSQVNLDQKLTITEDGVKRTFGFAKYLHDSLPNATYVGFTGTPIDATLDVFGEVVDSYTMTESVADEITVPIVYEGRAAKVILDNAKLEEIEKYYDECAEAGASDYAIEDSKKTMANMGAILGDPQRIEALAADFVDHYEKRVTEGSTVAGKALFVSSSRQIAYDFYQQVIKLRPEWAEVRVAAEGVELSEKQKKEILPMERIKMVMTRGKDDEKALYDLLGNKDDRKKFDTQFKKAESNFKIAIVVDMWLTGFDVPFLDTIYIDKPVQRHNLIQTISRVNR